LYYTVKPDYAEYNRQLDNPESLVIAPPHLLAALVVIVGPLSFTRNL